MVIRIYITLMRYASIFLIFAADLLITKGRCRVIHSKMELRGLNGRGGCSLGKII